MSMVESAAIAPINAAPKSNPNRRRITQMTSEQHGRSGMIG